MRKRGIVVSSAEPKVKRSDRNWEPVMTLVSLKAELDRRTEFSQHQNELEKKLVAFLSR